MTTYKTWQGILIAEGALIVLVLSLLGWQSWSTLSEQDITRRDMSPRAEINP
jgi:hypothetical protein